MKSHSRSTDPSLPGIVIPETDIRQRKLAEDREALIALFKPIVSKTCWACGRKKSGFVMDGEDLRTLRRRCIHCLKQDRREAAVAEMEAYERQLAQEKIDLFKTDLKNLKALSPDIREHILESMKNAKFLTVDVHLSSPLYKMMQVTLYRRYTRNKKLSSVAMRCTTDEIKFD